MASSVLPVLPVVLVHGARTSATMWRAQLEALEATGRPARAVDLPGHGVRRGEPFTLEGCDEVLTEAVDGLGGRAVLVGLSLGGYVAIPWAARNPDRVAGLVAAGCSTDPGTWVAGAWTLLSGLIERLPDQGARLNSGLVERAIPPAGARDLAAGGFALDVMTDLLTVVRATDPIGDLRRVQCPVWLVNGRWDHFRTQERRFLAACGRGRLVVVPGATHLVSLVRPVAFTRVLLEALDSLDRSEGVGPLDGPAAGAHALGGPGGSAHRG